MARNPLLALPLLLALAPAAACAADTVTISGASGEIELEISLPPGFDAAEPYSVLVSPGDYYWQGRPSQPGWIVVTSEAFWGPDRLENSGRVLDWLRERYSLRGGGFHIAGWSANSAGVFEIAMKDPDAFLSVTGVAGMPGAGAEDRMEKLREVRVQFIVGERDSYWRSGSERWHALLEEKGIESSLEIVPNGEHVMPELADEPFFERMNRLVKEIEARP